MAVSRNSLRGFLTHAKGALRSAIDSREKITFVIGNESADLDSMTSSILYAYVRSLVPSPNAFTPLYVPIANIPSVDIQLRPEFLAVFRHANIESEHMITLDDLPDLSVIKSKLPPENTKWILVDHNALQGQLGKIYSDRVGGVIDHHDDEGKIPKDTGSEPRVITTSGSCTSLVAEYCRQSWDMLSDTSLVSGAAHGQGDSLSDDGAVTTLWDAQVAQLGLASILIDTSNLQSKHKTTDHDIKATQYLEAKIMTCRHLAPQYERSKFYSEINTAQKDIGRIALQGILRKDYKQWNNGGLALGVSSVVKPIDFLQDKARDEDDTHAVDLDQAFLGALRTFSKARGLDLYAVMTTSTSSTGAFQRELLLWAFNAKGVSAAKKFAIDSKQELGLEDWNSSRDNDNDGSGNSLEQQHGDEEEWRKVWWQRQVQHSRKRVAPLLREAMN